MFFQHLMQRSGVFYFRRAVPSELRPIWPRTEIWLSLRTKERRRAELLARDLTAKTDKLFFLARLSMTEQELQTAQRRYLDNFLGSFEHHRNAGSTIFEIAQNPPPDALTFNKDFMALTCAFPLSGRPTEAGLDLLIRQYEEKVQYLRVCMRVTRFDDELRVQADRLISELQLSVTPPNQRYDEDRDECVYEPATTEYQTLCRRLLMTQIAAYEVEIERLKGNYENSYDRMTERLMEQPQSPAEVPPVSALVSAHPSRPTVRLSAAIDTFIAQGEAEGGLDPVTMMEYAQAYRLLPEIVGDKPVSDVTRDDVRQVLETLQRLPKHMNKIKHTRGKPIHEVLEITSEKRLDKLSPSAVEKKFQRIRAFLTWAFQEGLIEREICAGITFKRSKIDTRRPDEEQDAYTLADLQGLVRGMLEERRQGTFDKNPERYWIPLIALFSGCRLEEICQLHVRDVVQADGIWCFVIVPELDEHGEKKKRVKRPASKRLMPIHPTLLELGFIEFYQQEIVEKRQDHLWPALKRGSNGKFQRNIKDWYNGSDNRKGFENVYIDDAKEKSFHSTRHTFTTALKYLLIDDRLMTELLGQAQQSLAAGRYGKPFPPAQLFDALRQLDYKVDFIGELGRWPWDTGGGIE